MAELLVPSQKAAEDSRTPKPPGRSGMRENAPASWSAAVLCRFSGLLAGMFSAMATIVSSLDDLDSVIACVVDRRAGQGKVIDKCLSGCGAVGRWIHFQIEWADNIAKDAAEAAACAAITVLYSITNSANGRPGQCHMPECVSSDACDAKK